DATITDCSVSTKVGSDDVTCDYSGATASFDDKHAGTGKTVTGSGFALAGDDASDYAITTVHTTTANISALGLTVDFTAANKTYDGNADATITDCSVSTKVGSDDVTCDYSGATASFDDKHAGTGKTVTGSGFALAGDDASDYAITTVHTTTANISALGLTV